MSRTIPLSCGLLAIVDDDDFELLSRRVWYLGKRRGLMYAVCHFPRSEGGRMGYMHRVLMNAQTGEKVDHINHDGLDNRRSNLRICTHSQNLANQRKTRGTSKYKGVSYFATRSNWRATIKKDGRQRSLGYYANQEDAARAYDKAATFLFGEFANLNFPEELDRR